jgi:anaerobic magnesium-protoporphyrin IX monomethyl ester cyclase
MRVVLISPRLAVQKGDLLGSGVPYWPVGLATLAAFIRGRGQDVAVIDLFGSAPSRFEEKRDHYMQGARLDPCDPRIADADIVALFAISSMSHAELLEMVVVLRQRFPAKRIAVLENSQAVTAYDISTKRSDFFRAGADALVCGLPFKAWDQLAAWLLDARDGEAPEGVISAKDPERTPARPVERGLSTPVPAWDLFPIQKYWRLPYSHGPKTGRYLPLFASFGCPFPCDFCVIPATNSGRWRPRDPEEVVGEILSLRDRFRVRHFHVEDVNPTVKWFHWAAISELLLRRDARIRFYFVSGTKVETVELEQLELYARAGLRYLSISPESGSPAVLKAIGKPFDYDHALAVVKRSHKLGVATQACFLVGHPAETEEDHRRSIEYLRKLLRVGLSEAAFFGVSPLPGSKLFESKRIAMSDHSALTSFSPKGREDWETVRRRRGELLRIFFEEKLRRGSDLWMAGMRATVGSPQTKMENVPRRVLYVSTNILLSMAASRAREFGQAIGWGRASGSGV